MKKLIIILLMVTIYNCSPSLYQHNQSEVEKARNYWVGESKQTLVSSWGPPNSKSSDERGGQIYSYRRNNGYIVWITNFYINSNNRIYHLNAYSQ